MPLKAKLDKDHAITLLGDSGGELTLVKGHSSAYIWAGGHDKVQGVVFTFSGAASLRAFAKAILQEVRVKRPALRLRSEGKRK